MLLTLDLATNIGWTLGAPADLHFAYGSKLLPSTGEDYGEFACAFDMWLRGKLQETGVTTNGRTTEIKLVVFEAPILPRARFNKKTRKFEAGTSPITQRKLSGLCWHTEFRCKQMGIECAEGNNMKVKAFIDSGSMKKGDMVKAIARYGYETKNNDEADAIGLRLYTIVQRYPEAAKVFKLDLGLLGAS